QIRRSSAVVQFLEMARTGPYAASDHPHVEQWTGPDMLRTAAAQAQIHAHGGRPDSWSARANWSFVDGHVETLSFGEVFESIGPSPNTRNRFDPAVAQ